MNLEPGPNKDGKGVDSGDLPSSAFIPLDISSQAPDTVWGER